MMMMNADMLNLVLDQGNEYARRLFTDWVRDGL
jgi:hypothetical protein